MLHAPFSEPTRVGQKGMGSVVSPTVWFPQTNSEKPHERAMILYIIDNENQVQRNFYLISYASCSQTETLTIIKVAQIAAIFPTRRIINLPGISFWSGWRFLGWWTRSCIFTGPPLPINSRKNGNKKKILLYYRP